ncbi:hypothetical protein RhiJN_01254 [Ceratobasidium sp. AG-Ba]|nr:hypothetical protein RhiJN_01254 [Ceratobasidium sp. AG-Ba]
MEPKPLDSKLARLTGSYHSRRFLAVLVAPLTDLCLHGLSQLVAPVTSMTAAIETIRLCLNYCTTLSILAAIPYDFISWRDSLDLPNHDLPQERPALVGATAQAVSDLDQAEPFACSFSHSFAPDASTILVILTLHIDTRLQISPLSERNVRLPIEVSRRLANILASPKVGELETLDGIPSSPIAPAKPCFDDLRGLSCGNREIRTAVMKAWFRIMYIREAKDWDIAVGMQICEHLR